MNEVQKHKFAQCLVDNIALNNALQQKVREQALSRGELCVTITRDLKGVSHIRAESKHHETFDWDREQDESEDA